MSFKDAFKNAKKKNGKKIPPKSKASKDEEDMTDKESSGGFNAAFANAKKKKGGK